MNRHTYMIKIKYIFFKKVRKVFVPPTATNCQTLCRKGVPHEHFLHPWEVLKNLSKKLLLQQVETITEIHSCLKCREQLTVGCPDPTDVSTVQPVPNAQGALKKKGQKDDKRQRLSISSVRQYLLHIIS